MRTVTLFRWTGEVLRDVEKHLHATYDADHTLAAADSLLVRDRRAFALDLHRERFRNAVATRYGGQDLRPPEDLDSFWHATRAAIPPRGNWFPRWERRVHAGEGHFAFRLRRAPELTRAVTLITHPGPDPRKVPSVKGPDIEALSAAQAHAKKHGAHDSILVTSAGHIIDGTTNALVWWRGDTLCAPPPSDDDPEFARVASVTAKSLLGVASALGYDVRTEHATPAELDGEEVWALNALHGIRIATSWVNGPQLAERPGRISAWRERRETLSAPIGDPSP